MLIHWGTAKRLWCIEEYATWIGRNWLVFELYQCLQLAMKIEKNDVLRELNGLNELRGSLTIRILGSSSNKNENINLAEGKLEEK